MKHYGGRMTWTTFLTYIAQGFIVLIVLFVIAAFIAGSIDFERGKR